MSRYLAIDTATDVASVAIGTAAQTDVELVIADRRHATALAPAIRDGLALAGVAPEDLSGVILADGPGSFTGLRVGLATVKGMIRAHDHLTLAVAPSLLGLAWSARPYGFRTVAALYDALRGEVFAAVYRFDDGVETLVAPVLTTPDALAGLLAAAPDVAVGDGAVQHAEWAAEWTGRSPAGPPHMLPRGTALLQLGAVADAVQEIHNVDQFEPTYGRLAEAQVRWEESHGKPLPDPESAPG